MLSNLLRIFKPAPRVEWTLEELEAVLAEDGGPIGIRRTPYPWLQDARPLPRRTGRPHLRLVVNR